jgi:hypothetical protein
MMSIKSKIVSTGVEHVGASRRDFLMRSAIVGAAGIAGAIPALASAKNIEQTTAAGDPQKPPDIRPLAQLDSRFPVTYESSVPEALLLPTKYFRAVSARDSSAMVPLLHFPFASYEGTDPVVVESADKFLSGPPLSMNVSGQGPNLVEKDSYDMLDSLEVHTYNPVNVGLSLCYSRFGPDGKKQLECKGIYGVTNNDGKWGIECMSTIFTPADQVDVVYKDAIDATLRLQQNWMLGYSLRDQSVLNSTHQLGPQASLAPPEPRSNAGNARAGKPMDGYRTVGVKSRLHVSNVTAESIAKMDANFPEFSNWAGGGVGPWAYTLNLPNARVLHTSVNKVHSFGGYVRYLQDGTPTSESHVLQIVTYKNERWGNAGALGIMMYHDRTGDVRS